MENHRFLINALIYLAAAVISVPISKRLGLGSVLGYLAAGAIIGPCGLGLITDVKSILTFAELGVVLLLFIIGLELKPSRLWAMRRAVFGIGALQFGATAVAIGAVAWSLGMSVGASAVIGAGLSLSSTAFALQLLTEKGQLATQFGQTSFAILLFQDLAVIPILAILPLVSGQVNAARAPVSPVVALVIFIAVIAGGRFLLKPVFRAIAFTKTKEIFTAATLLLVLGIAALMEAIGLSMALGAFIAGLLLADSEYRHELEADIDPFKGLLLGLFFMGVGMSVDYGLLLKVPGLVITLVVGLVAVKASILFGVGRVANLGRAASRNMAVTISQGGEFAFVLFGLGTAQGLLLHETVDLLTVVVALSMAVTPLLVKVNDRFLDPFFRAPREPFDDIRSEDNPVIIAGFGRVGQMPARLLRMKDIGFTALEHDSEHVNVVRKFGQKIYYGDASRLDLLEAAGAKQAKVLILAIDDVQSSVRTAEAVLGHFPHLKIFARARNRQHAYQLMDLGITTIYRETFATSLELARDVLIELGLTQEHAAEAVRRFREHDETNLAEQHRVHKDEEALINASKRSAQQLTELFKTDKSS